MTFYTSMLKHMQNKEWLRPDDSVLVLAGGIQDRDNLLKASLLNVVISNLDYHAGDKDYAPYEWRRLDAEHIEADDNSFDWAIIHAGLHHLGVPAQGVCEMFRVARKGILCFESRDSLLMQLAVRIGLVATHELEPAFLSEGKEGGYRGGPIPNYVYRWTEREFEKVVSSFAPTHEHVFFYRYGYNVPLERFAMARSVMHRALGWGLSKASILATRIIPTQGNLFAFGALKNTRLQPWLTELDGELKFDARYLEAKYDKSKYWRNNK